MEQAVTGPRRVGIRDIEIEYEEHGSGQRPFLLVHGYTGSRDDWREQLPALSELGRTLALDQRGHGGSTNSGRPEHYNLDGLVLDLAAFVETLDLAPFDLLGHSMGGMVALRYTLAYPERVASLALMDTSAGPIQVLPEDLWKVIAPVARNQGMEVIAKGLRERAAGDPRRPEAARRTEQAMGSELFWERVEAKLLAMDPEAFATLGLGLGVHESAADRLGEISCPTLVVVGDQDLPFLAPSRQLAEGIPSAKLQIISDAAHSPQLEAAPAWLAAISEHLRRARAIHE